MKQGFQGLGRMRGVLRGGIMSALAITVILAAGRVEGVEAAAPAAMGEEKAEEWKFSLAAYLWGTSITGKTRAGDDLDVSFSDILDKLKFAGLGMAAARKDRFVLFGDAIFLKLEDDLAVTGASADVTMETWITQMAAGYTVHQTDGYSIDVFGGARYLSLDIDMDAIVAGVPVPLDLSGTDGVWNGIVGVKGKIELPKKWYSTYYFDVGTGDTHLTYQMMGLLGYRFDKLAVVGGYRYLRYNFDSSDTFGSILHHLEIQGPMLGVSYTF